MIILDSSPKLPEGARVEVQPVSEEPETPALCERCKDFIGIAEGLPADMAEKACPHCFEAIGSGEDQSWRSKKPATSVRGLVGNSIFCWPGLRPGKSQVPSIALSSSIRRLTV